jgi:hypothetical protein
VGGNISPTLPTNLFLWMGIRKALGILLLPVLLEAMRILLLPVLLGALGDSVAFCSIGGTFQDTFFLMEGYLLFVFISFGSF